MKKSVRKGFGFGLTSGIITTLGLIVGLHSSTHSESIIIGGILIIAIADALSDAMGIHISEEAECKNSRKAIWESTLSTLVAKFIFALTFVVPILLFDLYTAIIISIFWGLALIAGFSYYICARQKIKAYRAVIEHLVITIVVIVATHYVGHWVSAVFG
jgi:VIT1/CCC1 family predicted Fe2+/Mn2+ transporter